MTDREARFIDMHDPLFPAAAGLRWDVLHASLGLPADTGWDDAAPGCRHLAVVDRGKVVGYGRLQMEGPSARIRHVAVDPKARKGGIGSLVVATLVKRARLEGAKVVWLNARFTATDFYHRQGFNPVGGLIHDEGTHIPHRRMEMNL